VNRTDRLYALVEEMRAISPRPVSAARLAERFEVSSRTVERDISALQQAGVPIWAQPGRRGGYVLDRAMSLPPVNFTASEATALAVSLARVPDGPFAQAARSAMQKVLAAMPAQDAIATRALAARVRLLEPRRAGAPMPKVPSQLSAALAAGRCVEIAYDDRSGASTTRVVEPVVLLSGPRGWYLVGWCRLRDSGRAFRLDRLRAVTLLGEAVVPRDPRSVLPVLPGLELLELAAV
jgi:predicted DNA-binding transcriptional regulator YafY